MVNDPLPHPADFQFVQRCLEGDEVAVTTLLKDYHTPTIKILVKRGASIADAEYIVSGVWSECITRENGRQGRLQSFNGTCSLQTFLNKIVFNLWLTKIRPRTSEPPDPGPTLPDDSDEALIDLLSGAISEAFTNCSAEHYVVLQLLYIDKLKNLELARMFDCSESAMSKTVTKAKGELRTTVLRTVKTRDPLLELEWKDFVELCSAATRLNLGLD